MPLPSKIKKDIPLTYPKTLLPRRYQLLDKINQDGTYLPKSILHADLDKGFLEFVKNELKTIVDGKVIPVIDILITTQNWAQFTQTWDIQNIDKNVDLPFISIVRIPEVKPGTNPSKLYNIPNRRQYFYNRVPRWDGQRMGADIYKIPQPVAVDITYNVKIICKRMREVNQFNKVVLEMFSSRQAYTVIKGHYIPIIFETVNDESATELEKRKYYIQSYQFILLGFLMDEDEFEVSPAVSRVFNMIETQSEENRKRKKLNTNPASTTLDILFVTGNNTITERFDYTANLNLGETKNVINYDIFINNEYYGRDITMIQVNTNDIVEFIVNKENSDEEATISFNNLLV